MAGFSFGAPAAVSTPLQPAPPALYLAAIKPTYPTGHLGSFGAATPTPAFGATSTPTLGAAAPALAFGTSTPAPAFGAVAQMPAFGAPSQAPAPAFGSSSATPAFGATSFSFVAPSTQASAGTTNFGGFPTSQATNTSCAAQPLAFGATTVTSQAATGTVPPWAGFGGGTNSASSNYGTTTTSTPAAPTPVVGLGGIAASSHIPKIGATKQMIKLKESQVPDGIALSVYALKDYIKAQKTLSSDVARTSISKVKKVSADILNWQWTLQQMANSVADNYNRVKLMRTEMLKIVQSVDIAQKTAETPVAVQFENNGPFQFFQYLVAKYEQDLIKLREQIGLAERHMHSLTNRQTVTPEDLKRGFRQINESFISLAGRLLAIHQSVEAQKEQYLNLRKQRLKDKTNVFEKLINPKEDLAKSLITPGPTPFSDMMPNSNFGKWFGKSAPVATQAGSSQFMK